MPEELRLPPEIERYHEKWRKDPMSKVFAQLADAYRKIGMLDEAVDVCREGLKIQPSYVSARMVLARAYLEKGMDAEAEKEFLEVIKGDPNSILASRMLGDLLHRKGRTREAIEQYQKVLKLTPLDREIKAILEKAEAELATSASPAPSLAIARQVGEGQEEMSAEAPPLAQAMEEVLSVAANEPPPRERDEDAFLTETIADLYLRQGLYDRAVDIFSKMLSADPDNLHIQERLQEAILQQKGKEEEPSHLAIEGLEAKEVAAEEAPVGEGLLAETEPLPISELAEEEPTEAAPMVSERLVLSEEGATSARPRMPSSVTLSRWLEAIRERRKSLEGQWGSRND